MRLEKLTTGLVDSKRWLQRKTEACQTSPAAVDEFVGSNPENPLTLPANFPQMAHAAKTLRIEPLEGNLLSFWSGLRITGAALTGIPGAVLTISAKEGSLKAHFRHGKRSREIPLNSTDPNFLQLKLPSRTVSISQGITRDDGRVTVSSEAPASSFGVSATAVAEGLTSLTAHTGKGRNLVRMDFVQEKPDRVMIGVNQHDVHSFANRHGYFASSSGPGPVAPPTAELMFQAGAEVLGHLADSQRQRF